jgi:hypothetical protein
MTNWDMITILNYLINKNQAGGALIASESEDQLNYHSLLLFKRRLGMPEEYRNGSYITQQGYAPATRLLTDLQDFMIVKDGDLYSSLKFTNGKVAVPSDMAYPIGMIYKMPINGCGNQGVDSRIVEMVDEGEYLMRRASALTPISSLYPVFRIVQDQILIHPSEIGYADFTYIKFPDNAVVVTTTDVNGEEQYDANASTELEWNDLAKLDIIASMLSSIGLNLRADEVRQAAESLKIQGI